MAVLSKLPNLKRHWTFGLTLLTCAIALGSGLVISGPASRVTLEGIAERLSACREMASALRLLIIALTALAWPKMVRRLVQTTDARFDRIQALRWRVTAWLLTLEIVLGQNLLGRLFG